MPEWICWDEESRILDSWLMTDLARISVTLDSISRHFLSVSGDCYSGMFWIRINASMITALFFSSFPPRYPPRLSLIHKIGKEMNDTTDRWSQRFPTLSPRTPNGSVACPFLPIVLIITQMTGFSCTNARISNKDGNWFLQGCWHDS